MSGKALKRTAYWLKERNKKTTDVKKYTLEELHTNEHISKHEIKLDNYSFVETCGQKAQQKKIMENAIRYSKGSKDFNFSSIFRKL